MTMRTDTTDEQGGADADADAEWFDETWVSASEPSPICGGGNAACAAVVFPGLRSSDICV